VKCSNDEMNMLFLLLLLQMLVADGIDNITISHRLSVQQDTMCV